VADGLDVVAVRVEHVGAVVVRVVDLAHAGAAVVRPARRQRGGVERVHGGSVRDGKRDVYAGVRRPAPGGDPEERLAVAAEAADPGERLHQQLEAQRRQRLRVEGLAALVVGDVDSQMVEHCARSPWR
jgi:hypothetical protein